MEPKFIKVTDLDEECSELSIAVDAIERFHRQHPISTLKASDGKTMTVTRENEPEHTRIYLKGHASYHRVSETPKEIEALIRKAKEVIYAYFYMRRMPGRYFQRKTNSNSYNLRYIVSGLPCL